MYVEGEVVVGESGFSSHARRRHSQPETQAPESRLEALSSQTHHHPWVRGPCP